MNEIDKFLQFLFKHIDDDRIKISKELNFGVRVYNLNLTLEQEQNENQNFTTYNELIISIDSEHHSITMYNTYYDNTTTTVESKFLAEKWSNIFEKYLDDNIEKDVKKVINKTMTNVKDKDLFRDYQMEKIFKDDESV